MWRKILLTCLAMLMSSVCVSESDAQLTLGSPRTASRLSTKQFRGSGRVASLRDQLKAGLKARRDVEFNFIDEVVRLVEKRKLPVKLVVETFHYARRKPTGYPFQYFQRALKLRAARLGVTLKTV